MGEPVYMCRDCQCVINEGEAKTFGVCDDCFEDARAARALATKPPAAATGGGQ